MTIQECEKMIEFSYKFYDTIDFEPYLTHEYCMDVEDIQDKLEKYYDDEHPELLPKELEGYFFNYVDSQEFAEYLKKRYDLYMNTEYIEKHYICYK